MFKVVLTTSSQRESLTGVAAVVLSALLAVACASTTKQQKNTAGADRTGAAASRANPDDLARNRASASEGSPATCGMSSVYFDFDSSDLSAEARRVLQQNATCLQGNRAGAIVVTGMTDPRGTEEYNLALGDRRARAAAKYLSSLDLSRKPVTVRSVGEEFSRGSEEGGWASDRRAEFDLR